jgi:hypothetical protein
MTAFRATSPLAVGAAKDRNPPDEVIRGPPRSSTALDPEQGLKPTHNRHSLQ